jgi:hypothetical protein
MIKIRWTCWLNTTADNSVPVDIGQSLHRYTCSVGSCWVLLKPAIISPSVNFGKNCLGMTALLAVKHNTVNWSTNLITSLHSERYRPSGTLIHWQNSYMPRSRRCTGRREAHRRKPINKCEKPPVLWGVIWCLYNTVSFAEIKQRLMSMRKSLWTTNCKAFKNDTPWGIVTMALLSHENEPG